MTREELKKIIEGITEEQLKAILDIHSADIGKAKKDYETVKSENDTLKTKTQTLEDKIEELNESLSKNNDYKSELEELQKKIKEKEEKARHEAEDKELTDSILEIIKDKKFSSDYAKEGVIRDMKNLVVQKENKGKSYSEIFEALTKEKEGIFDNPNKAVDIPGVGQVDTSTVSDDQIRAAMGLPSKSN